jgi:hypothetical protein
MPKGIVPGAEGAGPTALGGAAARDASQDPIRRAQAELEQAETADDERRLEVVEDLHRTLESELDEAGSARS